AGIGADWTGAPHPAVSTSLTMASLGLSGFVAGRHGYADERPVLGPRTVVVLHIGMAEQLPQHEPGVRGALADAAVRDRRRRAVQPGRAVQLAQVVVGLEGAVLVGGLRPRNADRGRDVPRPLGLLLRQVRGREQPARVLVGRADVDEVLHADRRDGVV